MTDDLLPSAATAARLTESLRQAGALGTACVRNVTVMRVETKERARVFRLHLDYDSPAEHAPHSVFLKSGMIGDTAQPSTAVPREISFYRDIAPTMPDHLVPHCFEAAHDVGARTWHLLLEDLTDTHAIAGDWPRLPTPAQCEKIVRAQARLHAVWWDDPRLRASMGSRYDADDGDRRIRSLELNLARFTSRFGARMPTEWRELHDRLRDRAPRLLARYHEHRGLTVAHGDAHPWNFLLPRQSDDDDVRVMDWEAWRVATATDDLAYTMATLSRIDPAQRIEQQLLDAYHHELLAHGVSGYDRQALNDDYVLSALWQIVRPLEQVLESLHPRVWWINLERIMRAVGDLDVGATLH